MSMQRGAARSASPFLLALVLLLAAGCVADGGYGYPPAVSVGVGLDYYEPWGFDYGGWGPRYHVGPPREGMRPHGDATGHGFRPAPPGRAMPSIPTMPHGGARR